MYHAYCYCTKHNWLFIVELCICYLYADPRSLSNCYVYSLPMLKIGVDLEVVVRIHRHLFFYHKPKSSPPQQQPHHQILQLILRGNSKMALKNGHKQQAPK